MSECTCGAPEHPRRCDAHPWAYGARMLQLSHEALTMRVDQLMSLRVTLYADRRIGAHGCWSGTLEQWFELAPFLCNGCGQLVSRDAAHTVVTYTAERTSQQEREAIRASTCERCGRFVHPGYSCEEIAAPYTSGPRKTE